MSDAFPTLVPFIRYTSFSLFKLFGKKKQEKKQFMVLNVHVLTHLHLIYFIGNQSDIILQIKATLTLFSPRLHLLSHKYFCLK